MAPSRRPVPPENPDLWTLGRAAAFLGVSPRELLGLLRGGALRYVRRGCRTRVHRDELRRYRDSLRAARGEAG
jgi:hypothetical protein